MSEALVTLKAAHKVAFGRILNVTIEDLDQIANLIMRVNSLLREDPGAFPELVALGPSVKERNELMGAILTNNYIPFYGNLETL